MPFAHRVVEGGQSALGTDLTGVTTTTTALLLELLLSLLLRPVVTRRRSSAACARARRATSTACARAAACSAACDHGRDLGRIGVGAQLGTDGDSHQLTLCGEALPGLRGLTRRLHGGLHLTGARPPTFGARPGLGPERCQHLVATLPGGPILLRPLYQVHHLGGDLWIRVASQQRLEGGHPVVGGREHQGCLPPRSLWCVYVRAGLDERNDGRCGPGRGREMQWGHVSSARRGSGITSGVQQRLHQRSMPRFTRQM